MKMRLFLIIASCLILTFPALAHQEYSPTQSALEKARRRQMLQEELEAESRFKSRKEFFGDTIEDILKRRKEREAAMYNRHARLRDEELQRQWAFENREKERIEREMELERLKKPFIAQQFQKLNSWVRSIGKPKKIEPIYALSDKIHLKNGQVIQCRVLKKDDSGVWVEVDKGAKVYFKDVEIERIIMPEANDNKTDGATVAEVSG